MKRKLSLIFTALLLLSTMSCNEEDVAVQSDNNNPVNPENGETTPTTEPNPINLLPNEDYDGYEFQFLTRSASTVAAQLSFDADEMTGEIINDTVFERNLQVETRYNITITNVEDDNPASTMEDLVVAGDSVYAAMFDFAKTELAYAVKGNYFNLNKISAIDFNDAWWSSAFADALTINDKVYLGLNSLSTHHLDRLGCVFFNKDMVSDNMLDNPYELVLNEEWTMDVLDTMCQTVSADTDGDGKMTKEDTFGFIVGIGSFNIWINSADQPHVIRDENDEFILNYGTEAAISAAEKVASIINADYTVYLNEQSWGSDVFNAGRSLFSEGTLARFKELRDFDTNFGVVPCPKLNASQQGYKSLVNNDSLSVAIPIVEKDVERSATILNAMGAYSLGPLNNAYYEVTLKGKYAGDPDSIKMIDIISNNQIIDIGVMNEDAFGNVITSWLMAIRKSGAENMASLAASNAKTFDSVITSITEAYENMN